MWLGDALKALTGLDVLFPPEPKAPTPPRLDHEAAPTPAASDGRDSEAVADDAPRPATASDTTAGTAYAPLLAALVDAAIEAALAYGPEVSGVLRALADALDPPQ